MGSLLAAVVLLSGLVAATFADEVPVFVWGDLEHKSSVANPLERTTSADFERTLRSELTADPLLVAFVEETLSVEDLSRHDTSGATSLPYLQANLKQSVYFPAVRSAVKALEKIADSSASADHMRLTETGLSGEVSADSSVLIIRLEDARPDETRAQMLRRHDAFIAETMRKLKAKYGSVVAVYTANYPSWSLPAEEDSSRFRRHLMQAVEAAAASPLSNVSESLHVFNLTYAIIAIANISVSTNGSEPTYLNLTGAQPAHNQLAGNWVSLAFTLQDIELVLNISNSDQKMGYIGYWELSSVSLTNTTSQKASTLTTSSVYALHNFSYHCGQKVVISGQNATHTLTLENLQIQPFFFGNANKFGDALDCVGFFSMPIWSGIFVLTIILAIFFYGVVSIMDIRTMDRFDDPKGKTITINASE